MNGVYRVYWKRVVYFSGEIAINDELDPRIHADAHARTGELAGRCHGDIKIDSVKEDVFLLEDENTCSKCGETKFEPWEFQRGPHICKVCLQKMRAAHSEQQRKERGLMF